MRVQGDVVGAEKVIDKWVQFHLRVFDWVYYFLIFNLYSSP
jgi:hypothetical protein